MQTVGHVDVGIESHIDTVHVIVFQRTLLLDETNREVIHGDIVTTLDADGVVLVEGIAIDLFFPVGVVVILLIIVIARVLIQETEIAHAGACTFQQLRGIASILVGIHHVVVLRFGGDTCRNGGRNLGGHGVTALGLDEQDAIGTTRTVKGCTIAQYGDSLNVQRIDIREDIVEETLMQHRVAILLLQDDAIYDYERLYIGIQRVQALDKENRTDTWCTAMVLAVKGTTCLHLQLLLDVHCRRIGVVTGILCRTGIQGMGIGIVEGHGIEHRFLLFLTRHKALQDSMMVWTGDPDSHSIVGHREHVVARLLCQGTGRSANHTDNGSRNGFSCCGIYHIALNDTVFGHQRERHRQQQGGNE